MKTNGARKLSFFSFQAVVGLILLTASGLPSSVSAGPRSAPASKINLRNAFKDFEPLALKAMAEWKVPGLAVAVVLDGRVVYAAGFGYRDLEKKLPVTPHTQFGIGSCTKAFTAATLAILADEGKIDWDKPVRAYLPDFKLADPIISERATVRDIVTHKTGLPRHDNVWIRSPLSRREMFERLQFLDLNRDLRQAYQYNNLMFMTAGFLVGSIAGSSWEDFARARILEPLGLTETNFSVVASQKVEDYSRSYTLVHDAVEEFPFYNVDALGPAGSINSTVLDMARWIQLNIDGGRIPGPPVRTIVSEKQMASLHSPQTIVSDELRWPELFYSSYGVGWRINSYRGHPLLSHGGAIMGFSALTAFLPKDRIGIVLLNNLEDAPINGSLAYHILDRLLGMEPVDWFGRLRADRAEAKVKSDKSKAERDKDRRMGTTFSHPLSEYAGEYEHPAYGTIRVALDEKGGLRADYHQRIYTVEHFHYDYFRFRNDWMDAEYIVSFVTDAKGRIASLSIPLEPAVADIVFRLKSAPAAPEEKK
jgi:CubicO group peptidase (beta-lactamase class C family)